MKITSSDTDISDPNSTDPPVYSLKSNVDSIKIEYNCKKTGSTRFKLVLLPQYPLAPLRPIVVEFYKECKAIGPPSHVYLGTKPFDNSIYDNGCTAAYDTVHPTKRLDNVQSFTIFISLKTTNIFIQRMQMPVVTHNST